MAFVPNPGNPQTVPIRPLTKGMITEIASNTLPAGAFIDLENYIPTSKGIKKRSGYRDTLKTVLYPPVKDAVILWTAAGAKTTIIIDSKFIYTWNTTGLTPQYSTYATGNVASVTATAIVGSGTLWNTAASNVKVGDIIYIENVSGTADITATITAIADNTHLTIDANSAGNGSGSFTYEIRRAFKTDYDNFVISTGKSGLIFFTDGTRTPFSFDGTTYQPYSASITEVSEVLLYFSDRLWAGKVEASGSDYRSRLIWTSTTDTSDFTPSAADLSLDLPYMPGRIRRLLGLGDNLIAYFDDSIWFGRRTNIAGNALPYYFTRIETITNVGIVGQKAVCQYSNGHFFVGNNDVYYLTSDMNIQPLDSPIKSDLLSNYDNLYGTIVVHDNLNKCIKIGIQGNSGSIEKIWNFYYRTNAWSYESVSFSAIANTELNMFLTIDDLPTYAATIDGLGDVWPSINQIGAGQPGYTMLTGQGDRVLLLEQDSTADYGAGIAATFETPDYDFDELDKLKTFTRFSLKINNYAISDIIFEIYGSTNRGRTYTYLGRLTISANGDENFIDFKITGSTCRFRVTNSTEVIPFEVIEYSIKVIGRGVDILGGE